MPGDVRAMEAVEMSRLLSLAEVSTKTGQTIRRLRLWCATGSLACEPDGRSWSVRESELPAVRALAARRDRIIPDERAVALTVPRALVSYDLASRIETAMGLRTGEVSTTNLVLDGEEHMVAVWPHVSGIEGRPALEDLADELGGDLLDGEVGRGRI